MRQLVLQVARGLVREPGRVRVDEHPIGGALRALFVPARPRLADRGFSVHGEQTVPTDDLEGAERLARYLTRGPLPLDVVEKVEGGRLRVRTPPDPRTGLVEKFLDPLDLIHALTTQIPDPGQHLVRYGGWCSNRSRGARRRWPERAPPNCVTETARDGPPSSSY